MDYSDKSTIDEIRTRFDHDVDRFSNLRTGQQSIMDAKIMMHVITSAAARATPYARRLLDIGCGAGNNTLRLLQLINPLECDLVDLSKPMLDRAYERITAKTTGAVRCFHSDFREVALKEESYDIIIAAAVLHHLRDDADWQRAFEKIFALTAPGGSVWITDLIAHDYDVVQSLMWERYEEYLVKLGGEEHRQKVREYIQKEDTPRSVLFQLDLLRKIGFARVELLHKHSCFAAFGAVKA